tara:strand:+ start:43 stop:195 length:153 start_codon:yes stop_codon:yes gene_type:complete
MKDEKLNTEQKNQIWVKPSIKNIGNAKDIIANVNVTGGGDTQFSVLLPSL